MQDWLNAVRREAERVQARLALPRLATVSSYDPASHAVKVQLQPEGTETGWCPIAGPQVGNGWGFFAPPNPGDQVAVIFEDGNVGSPIVVGAVYSDVDRPVVEQIGEGCPAGEKWLVGKTGARLRLLNDGTVEIFAKAGTLVTLRPDGAVEIFATEVRIGAEGGAFRRLVDERFVQLFNQHVHPNTGPPVQQAVLGNHTTTTTKAE